MEVLAMRFALSKLFRESPFERLLAHAETVRSGGPAFRKAIQCYLASECGDFERLHNEITAIEDNADKIKQNIRAHLPKGIWMPVDKFQFLWYLREEDKVMDSMQDALHWLSYRTTSVPDSLVEDLDLMLDQALQVIEQLPLMVTGAIHYFRTHSETQREEVKQIIHTLRQMEAESDRIERKLKSDIFSLTVSDPSTTFHLIRFVEYIGEISNHAENAGDMMRAMVAR
jgi:uncharacterized protein